MVQMKFLQSISFMSNFRPQQPPLDSKREFTNVFTHSTATPPLPQERSGTRIGPQSFNRLPPEPFQLRRDGSADKFKFSPGQTHSFFKGMTAQGGDMKRHNSSYQMKPQIQGEENSMPQGGYSLAINKLGQKIRSKADLSRSHARTSRPQGEPLSDWVQTELGRLTDKIARGEERIDKLERAQKKLEEVGGSSKSVPPGQMEEINRILSLVEKSEGRDEQRKTFKMVEELRKNILELHQELAEVRALKEQQSELKPQKPAELQLATVRAEVQKSVRQKMGQLVKVSEFTKLKQETETAVKKGVSESRGCLDEQIANMTKRIDKLQHEWTDWSSKQDDISDLKSSQQTFEGTMVTLQYEQRLMEVVEKQGALVTTKTYYLDTEGYLLDSEKHYLMNKKQKRIKLSRIEVEVLRKHGIL